VHLINPVQGGVGGAWFSSIRRRSRTAFHSTTRARGDVVLRRDRDTVTPERLSLPSFRAGHGLECARPPRNTYTRACVCVDRRAGSSARCTGVDDDTVGAPLVTGPSVAEEVELIRIGARRAENLRTLSIAWNLHHDQPRRTVIPKRHDHNIQAYQVS
jgi:hypothetical protein